MWFWGFWVPFPSVCCSRCFLHWQLSLQHLVFICTSVALVGQGRGWMEFFYLAPQNQPSSLWVLPVLCVALCSVYVFYMVRMVCVSEWRGIPHVHSKHWRETNELTVHFRDVKIGSFDARRCSHTILWLHCVNVQQGQQFIFDLYYWATGTAENYVLVFHPLPLLQVNLNHAISFNS